MIAKLTTGNGFSGALKYDLRDGKLVETNGALPDQIKVLDAKDVSFDFDDEGNMILDVKQVAWDFRQQVMFHKGERVKPIEKPVYHWALSYHPDDEVSDEQMLQDTEEFLDRLGFGNTQYVVTAHRDRENPHVHVIANIVDNDGKRISTYKMIDKAHQVAADITKKRGYIWGEKASKKTVENAHKPHEKVRMIIEPIIKSAILKSISFDQLQAKLVEKGISCQVKEATDGKRGGISFGYEYKDQLHTFSGSSVDRSLTFGRIKQTLEFNMKQPKYLDTKIVFQEVPDEISLAINITGCPCNCEGCHSPYLAEDTGEILSEKALSGLIEQNPGITCVCFMGGDAYKKEVVELFRLVKQSHGLKTCWYSGRDMDYGYEGLKYLDFIKVGPYIKEKGPLNSPTTNQRFYKVGYDPKLDTIGLDDITGIFTKHLS